MMSPVTKVFVSVIVALAAVLAAITLAFGQPRETPASADVRDLKCVFISASGRATVHATIVNSTDEPRDYEVRVDFVTRGGARVGSETLVARAAKPGQRVLVETLGTFVPGGNPSRCEVA